MAFDPDEYLAKKSAPAFDPNAYLGQESPKDGGFSVGNMVRNIPSSAGKMVGDIYQAVSNPIDTAQTVGKTLIGAQSKLERAIASALPESMRGMTGDKPYAPEYEPFFEAAKQGMVNRYGSLDKALQTLENDPVGFMADVASVVSPVSPRAGAALNPVNMAINTTGYAAGKAIPKALPKSMYEGVAKFGTTIPAKKRSAMVETALANEIMPTSKGVAKLESLIDGLNTKIDDMISTAARNGESIPASAIYKYLKDLRQKKGGMSLDAPNDLKAIDEIVSKFQAHLKKRGKTRLTPKELQELKVNTYNSINWDAKRMTGTPIKEDTYKTIARGAKEGIEQMVPGVGGVNKSLGELYELQPHLQRAANRIENKNILSINDAPQIGAGAVVGGPAGAWFGAIAAFLGKDRIKAANAIRLQKLVNNANFRRFLENNPNISQAQLMAIISGREQPPIAMSEQ